MTNLLHHIFTHHPNPYNPSDPHASPKVWRQLRLEILEPPFTIISFISIATQVHLWYFVEAANRARAFSQLDRIR